MEHIGMFIIGAIIFGLYMAGYLFMIKYANDGQRRDMKRDNGSEYYQRHNQVNPSDYDGMGNFSRFPTDVKTKRQSRVTKKKVKTKI